MKFEQINNEKKEKEPKIEIINSTLAPEETKNNPFFNKYHWAMADWQENKLYLPSQSDEAISFAVASHGLGHLVEKNRLEPDREDFNTTYKEELRAWDSGWKYLVKHLSVYYEDKENIEFLEDIKNKVKEKLLAITELTKPFYEHSNFDNIKDQREYFLKTEEGINIKNEIDGLENFIKSFLVKNNQDKFLNKIDWDKFIIVIKKALIDIEKDNKNMIFN